MNKILLAILSSSSFVFLTLISVNPALARKLSPQELANPVLRSNTQTTQTVNQSLPKQNSEFPSMRSLKTQTIKELAIQQFGCDCPGCQSLASNMILQGHLPQFQPQN